MSSVWTQIESILSTKTENYDDEYHPWVVNTALSQHPDTVLAANEMNTHYHLPKRSQYDFYMGVVRKSKRSRQTWYKSKKNEDVELVCEVYDVNKSKALEYLRLLSDDQLAAVRESVAQGGKK